MLHASFSPVQFPVSRCNSLFFAPLTDVRTWHEAGIRVRRHKSAFDPKRNFAWGARGSEGDPAGRASRARIYAPYSALNCYRFRVGTRALDDRGRAP